MTQSILGDIFIYGYITSFCIGLVFLVVYIVQRVRYNPQIAWRHREYWEKSLGEVEPATLEKKLEACYRWMVFRDKQKLNHRVISTLFYLATIGVCIGFVVYMNQFSPGFFADHLARMLALLCIPTIILIGFLRAWHQYKRHALMQLLERTDQLKNELGGTLQSILCWIQSPNEDE